MMLSFVKSIVWGLAAACLFEASPALGHPTSKKGPSTPLNPALQNTCQSINYRRSWNVLTDTEKHEYIDAQLCLMHHPPVTGLVENATNVWDEFANIHISQANNIHYVGHFLPWHRYFLRAHELALQNLCNYTGGHPYWDELTDLNRGNISESPIFDPATGFGGNGTGSNYCVSDGPFKGTTLHMSNHHGRGNEFCLARDFNQTAFEYEAAPLIEQCYGYETFTDAWQCYNGVGLHVGGHYSVGKVMGDLIDSCNDPLFFMHHAYLDKLWWEWQIAEYPGRLYQMDGNNTTPQFLLDMSDLAQPGPDILDYNGDPGTITTLHHNLWMNSMVVNVTVGDIMQVNGSVICAEYVDDPHGSTYNKSVHTSGHWDDSMARH